LIIFKTTLSHVLGHYCWLSSL